jgi:hypothetical protein
MLFKRHRLIVELAAFEDAEDYRPGKPVVTRKRERYIERNPVLDEPQALV